MTPFHCTHCHSTVFFENDLCGHCGHAQGFVPGGLTMRAFLPPATADQTGPDGTAASWAAADEGTPLRPCLNRVNHGVCNWMLDDGDPQALCRSCRLTRVLPNLAVPGNHDRWQRIEQAKRRLVYTLLGLGLAPEPKQHAGDRVGLDFLLLEQLPGAEPVKTGHDDGTITLNVAEADDAVREALRVKLGEPMRTLLGHLRHEVAHYLQYRWVDGTPAADTCRALFGDERTDYAAALARHYAQGAPADWPQHHISAYASAHPWEDWAETCAHCLLVVDAVQTAGAWGLTLTGPATTTAVAAADAGAAAPALRDLVLQQWLPVAQFLNAMNRSLGYRDSYPFLLPPLVLDKMALVQQLLQQGAASTPAQATQAAPAVADNAPMAEPVPATAGAL
jgi:hypothetical protein